MKFTRNSYAKMFIIQQNSALKFLQTVMYVAFIFGISVQVKAAPGGVQYLNNIKRQIKERKLQAIYEQKLEYKISFIESLGYQPWVWGQSDCSDCSIMILPLKYSMHTNEVMEFANTIAKEKRNLLQIYHSDSQEYNLLAVMAMGILGRESVFFQSPRYKIKESAPWLIQIAKYANYYIHDKKVLPNSRGPTQIKIVPALIEKFYGITPDNIHEPKNAALATMGFLIEALRELKQRAYNRHLEFISAETYVDYLPYIYFGGARQLIKRTATPEKNIYIRDMKKYISRVQIYEQQK